MIVFSFTHTHTHTHSLLFPFLFSGLFMGWVLVFVEKVLAVVFSLLFWGLTLSQDGSLSSPSRFSPES